MEPTSLEFVKTRLFRLKGQWKRVATESGVPYKTIKNLMQGETLDPRTSTIDKLITYLGRDAT